MNKILVTLLVLMFVGCRSQKQPAIRYYTLQAAPEHLQYDKTMDALTDYKCEIRKVEINAAFASHRIASRESSNALIYYAYHQWAARPTELLTEVTAQLVQASGIFAEASTRAAVFVPDYSLQAIVHQVEAVQHDKDISAHLNVEFHLKQMSVNRIVVHHTYQKELSLSENSINAFALAISTMYQEALLEMTEKIGLWFNEQ